MAHVAAAVIRDLDARRRGAASGRTRVRRSVAPPQAPPVSNARIAIVMALVAETMFFAGLIGAYIVYRYGSVVWPPPNLPQLPLAVTWLNTVVLSVSGLTMLAALRAVRRNDARTLHRGLLVTLVLGSIFVGVQGAEWARLVHHGFTLSSGMYGSTFYVLIGTHAAHVFGAILWVGAVLIGARRGRYDAQRHVGVELCAIYWSFVCVLWLFLFALVYQ
jgi:cytochrome c oxidase subunit 3